MFNQLTVIITLFKTPKDRLIKLNELKGIKIIIFNQENSHNFNELKKIFKFKFKHISSKKNIGFSKATNILISKVKTKYFLFTQADISINKKSIKYLLTEIKKNKKIIFAGPNFKSNSKLIDKVIEKKYLNAACMVCDTKKVNKLKFFDEDYFLYWNDEDLMKRVNQSPYKMVQVLKAKASHESSKSSLETFSVKLIRSRYFKFGELVFDYKFNRLRVIKIFRQSIQSILKLFTFSLMFNKEKVIINLGYLIGIFDFIVFNIKKLFDEK